MIKRLEKTITLLQKTYYKFLYEITSKKFTGYKVVLQWDCIYSAQWFLSYDKAKKAYEALEKPNLSLL